MCRRQFTIGVWQSVLSLVGCSWVLDGRVGKVITEWVAGPLVWRTGVAWKFIPAVILWSIWKKTNSRIFDEKLRDIREVFKKAKWNLVVLLALCKEFVRC